MKTVKQSLMLTVFAVCTAILLVNATQLNAQSNTETPTQRGFRIIADQRLGNCMACHSMPDTQGKKVGMQSTFAPPLDTVAARYDAVTLRQWVADARNINPETLMPPFAANGILTTAQVNDVLAALLTLK